MAESTARKAISFTSVLFRTPQTSVFKALTDGTAKLRELQVTNGRGDSRERGMWPTKHGRIRSIECSSHINSDKDILCEEIPGTVRMVGVPILLHERLSKV